MVHNQDIFGREIFVCCLSFCDIFATLDKQAFFMRKFIFMEKWFFVAGANTCIHTNIQCFMFSNQNVYFRHPLEIHAIYAIQIHKIRSYCTSAVSPSKNCVYLANKTKVNWWRKMSYEWDIYRVIVTYATSAFYHQK